MKPQQPFPKDFLWGASTASHQVEGNTMNQWSVWELENAARLAKTAEERLGQLPAWPRVASEASQPENYVSGAGIEHYERFETDFDLLTELNLNAFRFGIEWSRLEPSVGMWDQAEIEHYHTYIDALLARGIEPVLNLWHWTMPTWFTDAGGFAKRANLVYFDEYVRKVVEEYGSKVRYIITLNEPNVYTSFGYLTREWPPSEHSFAQAWRVYRNLVRAHRQAYDIIKGGRSDIQVGVAAQLANIQAERPHNVFDGAITKLMRYGWNWWFLNRIRNHQDFVGINYYFTDYYRTFTRVRRTAKPRDAHEAKIEDSVSFMQRENPSMPLSDLGWYMEPEGLYPLLLRVWRHYGKPIMVTENGLADAEDQHRRWWLQETIIAMERAIGKGVEIKGYMHWSLLDNFEWAYGWWPRFGLVAVDREHGMKRTIRPSARWFGCYVAELRGIEPSVPKKVTAASKTAPVPPQHRYKVNKSTHGRR